MGRPPQNRRQAASRPGPYRTTRRAQDAATTRRKSGHLRPGPTDAQAARAGKASLFEAFRSPYAAARGAGRGTRPAAAIGVSRQPQRAGGAATPRTQQPEPGHPGRGAQRSEHRSPGEDRSAARTGAQARSAAQRAPQPRRGAQRSEHRSPISKTRPPWGPHRRPAAATKTAAF